MTKGLKSLTTMTATTSKHDGNATVIYFDNEQFAGTQRVYCCGYDGQSAYYPNVAMFCAECGRIWGRRVYDFHFTYHPLSSTKWITEAARCPEHGDGSFLGYYTTNLLECSEELIRREFTLLMERYNDN